METRLRPLAVTALAALVLTGCVGLEPTADLEEEDQSGSTDAGGSGESTPDPEEPEIDPAELTFEQLDADEIQYLLLDEDDWPYSVDGFDQEEDDPSLSEYYAEFAEYWVPLDGIDYSSEEEDCFDGIAELEDIETDGRENHFVSGLRENPNTSYEEDGILVGISSFRDEQDTASVWEAVLDACDGVEIEEDGDVVSIGAVEQGEWSGVHMTVQAGSFFEQDLYFDDILLATLDRGENIVYAVGMDVPAGTFTDVLRVQERKLDEGLPEDLDEGDEDDDHFDEDDDGGLEDDLDDEEIEDPSDDEDDDDQDDDEDEGDDEDDA